MIPVGTAVGYLTLDYSKFSSNLKTAIGEATSMSGKLSDTLGRGLSTVGNSIASVGRTLTTGITLPIAGATAASVKFGSEFDKRMSEVRAVSNATTDQFNKMRDAAISWGEKTVYTATEAGDALYYMGLAGWEPEKSIAALGSVLNLAAAGDLELGRTSDIVTDAMTAMNYEAGQLTDGIENTEYFVNSLAAAMSNSNTDVDQLGSAFKYVSPLAGALNMNIKDLTLALGLMANVGVKGTQAGTGLRQALKNLIAPTDKAQLVMDKYAVSLFDASGKAKNMRTFMEELRGTFGDLKLDIYDSNGELKTGEQIMEEYGHSLPITQQEKLNAIVEIFGTRALPGILGIINQTDEKFNNLADSIDNSNEAFVLHNGTVMTMKDALDEFGEQAVRTGDDFKILGAAEGMALMQMDNLKGDWIRFTSALGTSKIMITDLVKGALREFVQKLTELVKWFNNLDDEHKKHILKVAATVAAIGPLLLIFGKLIAGIGNVITGFQKMSTAFNLIKTGFTLVGTKIKNIGEAFSLAKAGFTGFAAETSPLGTALAGLTPKMVAIGGAVAAVAAAFVHLMATNEEFRNKIASIWDGIKQKFASFCQGIVDRLNQLGFSFKDIIDVLSTIWNNFCNLLAPVFEGAFGAIAAVFGGILDVITGILDVFIGLFTGNWEQFWNGIKEFFIGIWDGIKGIFEGILTAIKGIADVILGWFGTSWDEFWSGIKQFFINIWEGIKNFFSNIMTTIQNIAITIWNAISSFFTTVLNAISTTFTNIWNGIKNFVGGIIETIKNIITTAFNVIKDTINIILNAISTIFTNVWNSIKNFVSSIWDAIKNIVSGAIYIVKDTIDTVLNTISSIWSNIWNGMRNFVSGVWDGIKSIVSTAMNAIKDTISSIMGAIKSAWEAAWNGIKSFAEGIWKGIEGIVSKVKEAIDWIGGAYERGKKMLEETENNAAKANASVQSLNAGVSASLKMSSASVRTLSMSTATLNTSLMSVSNGVTDVSEQLNENIETVTANLSELMDINNEITSSEGALGTIAMSEKPSDSISLSQQGEGTQTTGGGDTINNFTFYSNEPINEIQASKLLKETQRDLAEGYI